MVCRCVSVTDRWVRRPINIDGSCVSCGRPVYDTVAGRMRAQPTAETREQQLTERKGDCSIGVVPGAPREAGAMGAGSVATPARSVSCCSDPGDCLCGEAA